MLQQTPLAVNVAPPSAVTIPPDEAVVGVMFVTEESVTEGAVFIASCLEQLKIKEISIPARSTE